MLTRNKKSSSYCDDNNVPQAPEVCCVEESPSVSKFAKLITCKCCNPYVEHHLNSSDLARVAFYKYSVCSKIWSQHFRYWVGVMLQDMSLE